MRAKPESTINSWKSRASNLIVLVESEIKHKIYHKNIEIEAVSIRYCFDICHFFGPDINIFAVHSLCQKYKKNQEKHF